MEVKMKKLFIIGALFLGLQFKINCWSWSWTRGGSGHSHQYYVRKKQAQAAWRLYFDAKIQPVIDKINEMTRSVQNCDLTQLQTNALNQINTCKQEAYAISSNTPAIVPIVQKIKQIFVAFYNQAKAAIQQCVLNG